MIVAPRFHDVDFAACGPGTVHGVGGHHPDGWPKPVAFGDLSSHFDASGFDCCAESCVDAARFDGWDDGPVGGVG